MALLDAHIGSLLIAIAAVAVVLGVGINVLAVRLMLEMDRAANDPVFRRSHRTRSPRARAARTHLHLVS